MRPEPKAAVQPVVPIAEPWSLSVEVELITRLFGGGARARGLDGVAWLRSSAVKSALRAWWRAGHAASCASLDELRAAEKALFGAPGRLDGAGNPVDGPGAVQVAVDAGKLTGEAYAEPISNPLNGAYFPARSIGQDAALVARPSKDAIARLRLMPRRTREGEVHAGARAAIEEGLRLWLTLGGAGARTRRGAGALALRTPEAASALRVPASQRELEAFLRERCARRSVAPALDAVFSLARTRSIFISSPRTTAEEAQHELLSALREARQDRPHPKSWSGKNDWGRSRWPEADAIRLKAARGAAAGRWRHEPAPANAGRYPRAALGLPIVVQYAGPREPDTHHVLGAVHRPGALLKLDRYASPILLRPVRVWDGQRAVYVPVAVFTDCTLPEGALPLVTTTPNQEARPEDVVRAFEIRREADATLRRVEGAFQKQGFKRL